MAIEHFLEKSRSHQGIPTGNLCHASMVLSRLPGQAQPQPIAGFTGGLVKMWLGLFEVFDPQKSTTQWLSFGLVLGFEALLVVL